MSKQPVVDVVIPARNVAATLPGVIAGLPSQLIRSVVVVDNASGDRTAAVAEDAGAVVVRESRVGYGSACLRGIRHLASLPIPPDIVVFLSGDGSLDPAEIPILIHPLKESVFDLVIGAPAPAPRIELDSLVAVHLIHAIYGHRYTSLGRFRALRYPALVALGLRDAGHGWLVEMQVKALKIGLRVAEVPVTMRQGGRRPRSLPEQLRKAAGAGGKLVFQIFRHATAR